MAEFRTFTAIGQREDLSNTIYNIAPTETPVVSSIGKTKATATYHEWQTDTLLAASAAGLKEGDDAAGASDTPTTRVGTEHKFKVKQYTSLELLMQLIKLVVRQKQLTN